MPTKKETIKFIRENNVPIKAPTSMKVNEVLNAVDKAVEKMPKTVSNKWKKLKLIHDMSPAEKEAQKKRFQKRQLKAGTLGKPSKVPFLKRDRDPNLHPSIKQIGKGKYIVKRQQAKNIDDEIMALHHMSDRLQAKKKKSKN